MTGEKSRSLTQEEAEREYTIPPPPIRPRGGGSDGTLAIRSDAGGREYYEDKDGNFCGWVE